MTKINQTYFKVPIGLEFGLNIFYVIIRI